MRKMLGVSETKAKRMVGSKAEHRILKILKNKGIMSKEILDLFEGD